MLALVDVASVVDVGCGIGTWLDVARVLGVERSIGVEGEWAREWVQRGRIDARHELHFQDLEQPVVVEPPCDLVICLEVAEHLRPERSAGLVADLCRAGRIVLFGAAIPGQGGAGHVNERWPSEWAHEFARHGRRPLDVLRRRLWDQCGIPFWYPQNMLLYVPDDERDAIEARIPNLPTVSEGFPLDVVHPALHLRGPSVRAQVRLAARLPVAVLHKLRHRWRWRPRRRADRQPGDSPR